MEINKVQWRMIAKGEKLPCDSFLMKKDGTIPSVISGAGAEIGQDAYYLPVEELRSFPKEESEDEKISREITEFLVDFNNGEYERPNENTIDSWLSWLEKQGEKKPVDKVEPKFHKGDWIVHHGTENIYQVVAVIDNQYQLKYGDTYTVQKCVDVDRCARLWDIAKDAKDGDVLATLDYILIFKKILSKDGGVSYCHYDFGSSTPQFNFNKDDNWYFGKEAKVYPATKGQRDTLMKAMADAGYIFDFEKKELKKIKQKAVWSEDDNRMRKAIIDNIKAICKEGYFVGNIGSDKLIDWLKSLRPQSQWKPSYEQIKALEAMLTVSPQSPAITSALIELYQHLKKLREE